MNEELKIKEQEIALEKIKYQWNPYNVIVALILMLAIFGVVLNGLVAYLFFDFLKTESDYQVSHYVETITEGSTNFGSNVVNIDTKKERENE